MGMPQHPNRLLAVIVVVPPFIATAAAGSTPFPVVQRQNTEGGLVIDRRPLADRFLPPVYEADAGRGVRFAMTAVLPVVRGGRSVCAPCLFGAKAERG